MLTYRYQDKRGRQTLRICAGEPPESDREALKAMGRLFSRVAQLDDFLFVFRGWASRTRKALKSCVEANLCAAPVVRGELTLVNPTSWDNIGELLHYMREHVTPYPEAFAPATPGYVPRAAKASWFKRHRLEQDLDHIKWYCFFDFHPYESASMELSSKREVSDACGKLVSQLRAEGARRQAG